MRYALCCVQAKPTFSFYTTHSASASFLVLGVVFLPCFFLLFKVPSKKHSEICPALVIPQSYPAPGKRVRADKNGRKTPSHRVTPFLPAGINYARSILGYYSSQQIPLFHSFSIQIESEWILRIWISILRESNIDIQNITLHPHRYSPSIRESSLPGCVLVEWTIFIFATWLAVTFGLHRG